MTWSSELLKPFYQEKGFSRLCQAGQDKLHLSEKHLEKWEDKLLYLMIPSIQLPVATHKTQYQLSPELVGFNLDFL